MPHRQETHVARRLLVAATSAIALVAAGLGTVTASAATTSSATPKITTQRACSATPAKGHAHCLALIRTDPAAAAATAKMASAAKGGVNANATPSGYAPSDIRSAYALTNSSSSGRTVAIVDAYDDPTAEQDLAVYRSQFGLSDCTTANGCFKKVNQSGGKTYPRKDGGWAQEISLDLDMVSATCPDCKILLVEATTSSFANLGAAVNYAASQTGVVAISNSYGGSDASDANYGKYYNHAGKAVTVSSGDSGYGAEYPASSQYVTAVGGTSLRRSTSGAWTETAWSGAGSGCSAYNGKLSVATAEQTAACGNKRAEADVSAVADPQTGVAVYDSTAYQGRSGWLVFGGTSASAPIIASVYALSGNVGSPATGTAPAVYANTLPYKTPAGLHDVVNGSNGSCGAPLCQATSKWDGPTGLGTPNGTGAF
jgi:subtilase family serine protease